MKKERSSLVRGGEHKAKGSPRRPRRPQTLRPGYKAPKSPYSPSKSAARSSFSKSEDNSSYVSTAKASSCSSLEHDHFRPSETGNARSMKTAPRSSTGEVRNPALEAETQRLDALKRRRFMELQQTLAYELRSLAREVSKLCGLPQSDKTPRKRRTPRGLRKNGHEKVTWDTT